jgi:hypothetical protein
MQKAADFLSWLTVWLTGIAAVLLGLSLALLLKLMLCAAG